MFAEVYNNIRAYRNRKSMREIVKFLLAPIAMNELKLKLVQSHQRSEIFEWSCQGGPSLTLEALNKLYLIAYVVGYR
jgi:hypothetical protein